MSSREQFEAWLLSEYPNQHMGQFSDGEYQSTTIHHCWSAWQASRAAVVVDLPMAKEFCGSDGAYFEYLEPEHVEKAIEACGLKVGVK